MASASLGGSSAIARFAEIDHAAQNAPVALTLTPPQQASLLERCLPFFKDAISPHDIAKQIAALCKPVSESPRESSVQGHARRVQAFKALTRLAPSVNRALFVLAIVKTMARVADGTLREQLGYRFLINELPVAADNFPPGQEKPMLRFLREVDRAELPVRGQGRVHVADRALSDHMLSRQFVDAHLLNRLIDALPDDARLSGSTSGSTLLDTLALHIDQINTHAEFEYQHHVALGEKVAILAEAFPEHEFALTFATKFRFEGGHYAVVLQRAADSHAPSSPVPEDCVLYEAEVSLWESDQYVPMIVAAVQRQVRGACTELQPLLDLAAARHYPPPPVQAHPPPSLQLNLKPNPNPNPNPNHQIDIDIVLKNALAALRDDYLSNLPGALNPDALTILHRSVGAISVGNTTIGTLWELDKQVFDAEAEQASLGLPTSLPPDPQRFA